MADPVQLKYVTKDGAERVVILPTIDIDGADMLAVLAGILIHQHDTIVQIKRRLDALQSDGVTPTPQEYLGEVGEIRPSEPEYVDPDMPLASAEDEPDLFEEKRH